MSVADCGRARAYSPHDHLVQVYAAPADMRRPAERNLAPARTRHRDA